MDAILKIISFTRHLKKWYLAMAFFVITISLLSLVGPLLSKQIVDVIVAQVTGKGGDFTRFLVILGIIIATDILITILTAISQWIGDMLSVKLQTYLSQKFYQHILNLHIGYYDNEITGNIINKMYRGITSITEFIQSMFNNFLPFFLTALVTILLLSFYSPIIGGLLAILFPVYILISHGSTKDWMKYEGRKNNLNDISQGRVFESISGIRIVKAFSAELHELKSFLTNRSEIEKLTVTQTKRWHLYDFARRLFLNLIIFSIYAYIVYWTFNRRYTIGEMTLLLQLAQQARFPLFAMSFILGQIQQAGAGSKDFFKILETKNEIKDRENSRELIIKTDGARDPRIEFNNVYFNYQKEKTVLHDITFKIFPGEKVALVGESGQGKSTIVNLLLRYYEPQQGEICIDQQGLMDVTQHSLHETMGVVFQESLLFSGTIMENIKYGKPDAAKEEIIEAARAANAHTFIEELPDQYNSIVGERGVKLSGGQKQRIAIARAILKNAPIIILDEATSSLDTKSELEVQKGLDRLLKNRTGIIIAHRLSTIASADRILVIANGTISQNGTSRELMENKNGLYYKMVSLQQELLTLSPEERAQKLQEFDLVE